MSWASDFRKRFSFSGTKATHGVLSMLRKIRRSTGMRVDKAEFVVQMVKIQIVPK